MNKKTTLLTLTLALVIAFALIFPSAVMAEKGEECGFSKDFDSSTLDGEEEPVPGEAAQEPTPVIDGQAQATPQAVTTLDLDSVLRKILSMQVDKTQLAIYIVNLMLSALLAYILGVVYVHWGTSLTNRRKFAGNFMLLALTTTFIILVVRSSVALSLGLVGALSIVRFRAAIKEPEELAYLVLAIGIGIGLGDNQRLVTLFATAAAIAILGLRHTFRHSQADVNLHLSIAALAPQKINLDEVMAALQPYCSKLKLLRYDENKGAMEISFLVEFKKVSNLNQARDAVYKLAGDELDITFLDNKGVW